MKKTWLVVGIIVVVAIIIGGSLAASYNKLVSLSEAAAGQWAQVENQLKRRADLIPNLVQVVKGYASHETEVFTKIADARAKLAGTLSQEQRIEAENQLSSALARLLVVVERYPELKADQQFTGLRDELVGTENRLAVERMRYNEIVQQYNRTVRSFPMLFFARMFGFQAKPYYQVPPDASIVPEVKF
ncbi:MAG TPA: LemA family protein [Firmicutes bacterium]|nr:LemA family protein [Bacillota bacterium]